jgi:uncharacterized protein
MKHEYSARSLHVAALAQQEGQFSGQEALAAFPRLAEEHLDATIPVSVAYQVRGWLQTDAAGHDEPWLHLAAQTRIVQVCQRCLGPVEVEIGFERDFRFVATEALAEVEDEESEEDVLVLSKQFDLLELIEDELLMATPPAPKHSVCPKPLKLQAADPDFQDDPEEKPHPFAVLQSLKKKDLG